MTIPQRVLAAFAALLLSLGTAQAEDYEFLEFGSGNLYAGGGLSYNKLSTWQSRSYDEALGGHGFFGWDFFQFRELTVAGEAGLVYTGDFDYPAGSESFSGAYLNAVAKYPLTDRLWVQARLGGNTLGNGVGSETVGGGLGFRVAPNVSVRAELVSYGSDITAFRGGAFVSF